ncbi:MAG: hypothetical protein GTO14_19660 [Anaerolineales bacterium]|nr:hypothetical protein [Anaerolineales bacterium]
MHETADEPRALFLSKEGDLKPDSLICSGKLPAHLEETPCPFSKEGRMPAPQPLVEIELYGRPELGRIGELAPPCAIEQLGDLASWQGSEGIAYPEHLSALRIFKCRQMFLLVVPGIRNHNQS